MKLSFLLDSAEGAGCLCRMTAQDGTATLREWHDYVDPAVTTTSKRPSRTNPTDPTQPTDPGHPDEGHGR